MKKLTPDEIIQLIIDNFDVDIREKNRNADHSSLRSMYYYLAQKILRLRKNLETIGNKVNCSHATVIVMTRTFVERVNLKSYEILKRYCIIKDIIENDYKNDKGVQKSLEIQDYDLMKLQNMYKRILESNRILNNRNTF